MHYLSKAAWQKLLMTLFCLAGTAGAWAAASPQIVDLDQVRLTISFKDLSLKEALEQVKERSFVSFAYNETQVNVGRVISASFKDTSLRLILETLLHKHGIDFQVDKDIIILSPRKGKPAGAVPQTGSIRGSVYDSESREALPGSSIQLEGTQQGASADAEGNFALRNVAQGDYNILVSFVGYQTKRLEHIRVTPGNVTQVEVPLSTSPENLGEVVVVSDVDVRFTPIENSTEESLISDIRGASNVVTGISNLQIARSLDRDAADVVKRVPGVTLLNNFVLVRGMDPRYNVTYLNNMLIPSTESDSRAFGFNLIPSGLIDDIKIYKAPAPELPGGFGGGVIRVNTKKSQATRHIQVDLSTQYRSGGSSFADYYTGSNDSERDWIAGGAKKRELPADFHDKNFQLPDYNFYAPERVAFIRSLPQVNQLQRTHHNLDRRLSINYYDSYKLGGMRLSNLTAFGYTYQRIHEVRTRADRGLKNWTYDSEGSPISFRPENQSRDSTSMENVRLSLLENVILKINDRHSISFNLFANRNAEDNVVLTAESHTPDVSGNTPAYPMNHNDPFNWRTLGFEYRVRDLISGQLHGEHTIVEKHKLTWSIGRSQQTDYIPDWQAFSFRNSATPGLYDWQLTTYPLDNNVRQYYRTEETVDIGTLDYSVDPLPFFTVSTGMLVQLAHRSFSNFNYAVVAPTANSTVQGVHQNLYQPWFRTQDIYAGENFKENRTGFDLGFSSASTSGSYSFDHNITAAYLAVRLKLISNKLELYGGVRYENEYAQLFDGVGRRFEAIDVKGNQAPGPVFEYYLPSANLTWNINDQHKLRTTFGKTIDRPAYRERSTGYYYSIRDNVVYEGNPFIKNATLDNYDLRWEWYPTEGEFIALGGYYKSIKNPIEMKESGASGSARLYRSWENKRSAELFGIEVEVHKKLGFIPGGIMKQFSVIVNGSYMHTVISELIPTGTANIDARPTRPLAGSSPYAANISLYYEHPRVKTQLTASYNYIGERIITTSVGFVGNLHEKAQHLLDFTIIQPIGKYLKLKGGVQNLLNRDMVRWRDGNYDGKYNPGVVIPKDRLLDPSFEGQTDHEAERWNTGAYYSLGLSIIF